MDNIEDLYDDMAEMMADMEEVQEVMGRTYNCDYDEDGLMDELNELDEEIACEQLGQGSAMPSYIPNSQPAQPNAVPEGGNANTEAAALQNMMNL